jgi:RNA polymerase-binding transcription factor DksA
VKQDTMSTTSRAKRPPPATSRKRRRKASTGDVLGGFNFNDPARIQTKWRKYFRTLLDLRAHLRSQKGELLKDALDEDVSIQRELADVGTNSYDRDLALSMISSEQNALYEIEQALNRIKNGTYGICEVSGKPIPLDRLDAVPWTRFGAEAEREIERRGQAERAKLGDRERVPKFSASQASDEEE